MKFFRDSDGRKSLLTAIVLCAALSRLLPHSPNFTPIGALALFGGAQFRNVRTALIVVLGSMLLSDLCIGSDRTSFAVYVALTLTVLIGVGLKASDSVSRALGSCVFAAIVFFLVTNFAVWLDGQLYPRTLSGLTECFVLAVPFFWNTLFGDLFYFGLLNVVAALGQRTLVRQRLSA